MRVRSTGALRKLGEPPGSPRPPPLVRYADRPRRGLPRSATCTSARVGQSSGVESRLEIRTMLERARAATEALLEPIPDDVLVAPVGHDQPPLVWDYAQIAYFEELWLLRNVNGDPPISHLHDEIYAARPARAQRPHKAPDPAARRRTSVRRRRALTRRSRRSSTSIWTPRTHSCATPSSSAW